MLDFTGKFSDTVLDLPDRDDAATGTPGMPLIKRSIDLFICGVLLLPAALVTAVVILLLNRRYNPGPLFYVQRRMGYQCKPFHVVKFRTMLPADAVQRTAEGPLELDRITPLGSFLRKTRLDELPQIFNVIKGEMSLIGPRPDTYEFAAHYLDTVPGYRARHAVRPGISGFAQTEVGYVTGSAGTRLKVRADLHYIQNLSLAMELWLMWRTLTVVVFRKGI